MESRDGSKPRQAGEVPCDSSNTLVVLMFGIAHSTVSKRTPNFRKPSLDSFPQMIKMRSSPERIQEGPGNVSGFGKKTRKTAGVMGGSSIEHSPCSSW